MATIGVDTETYVSRVTRPGKKGPKPTGLGIPPVVVTTFAARDLCLLPRANEWASVIGNDGYHAGALLGYDGARAVVDLIRAEHTLVAHNAAFDIAGWYRALCECAPGDAPVLLDALESGQLRCTYVRELLLAVAFGYLKYDHRINKAKPGFSLADVARARLGIDVGGKEGPDAWRMRYAELDGVPFEQWPREALDYALNDAVLHLRVYEDQSQRSETPEGIVVDSDGNVTNERQQTAAAFALHLCSANGPRTDAARVEAFRADQLAELERATAEGQRLGFVRADGTLDRKALQALVVGHYGANAPKTDKGAIQTSEEVLEAIPALSDYIESKGAAKIVSTYLPILEAGTQYPVTSRPIPVVGTGRTAWQDPNLQNPPRAGDFRACFTARPGRVYSSTDYNQIELAAVAQVELWWFGTSRMAEVINAGQDCHTMLAAEIATQEEGRRYTYEEARHLIKDVKAEQWAGPQGYRQLAKIGNFGFNGGLGAKSFVPYAKQYGAILTEDKATIIRNAWLTTFPQKRDYFNRIAYHTRAGERFTVVHPVTNRQRADVGYTDGCNSYFQGLTADGAKAGLYALWARILRAEAGAPMDPRDTSLVGVRPWLMLHDEILAEGPEDTAWLWGPRIAEVMIEEMKAYIPDVRVSAETALMRRWYKKADPVYVDGRLVPWEPTK